MDDFKFEALFHKQGPYDDWGLEKKFGRRAARRQSKQIDWMQDYFDVNYPSGWEFGGMFCDDYDYWDMEDIMMNIGNGIKIKAIRYDI